MASSQPSQNVEMEAAKFLQKLIQESKDEPAKLAMKLYVILQHMKSSGKEHSMPYQVISRAMETVINQHGLDIEALKSSRLPLTGGPQVGDSSAAQHAGSSQAIGVPKIENEISKSDPFASSRPPLGSSSAGHDYYQGSGTHRSSQSFDHESPSSLDTRSANSQSQERGVSEKDGKKAAAKRKRGDSSLPADPHNDNPQQLDARSVVVNPRKVKMNKVDSPSGFTVRISESNAFNAAPNSGYLEVSSAHVSAGQQLPSGHESFSSSGVWNQSKAGLPLERSQVPRFTPNAVSGNITPEIPLQQSRVSSLGSGAFNKVHGGMSPGSSSYQTGDLGFSGGVHFNGSEHQKRELARVSVTNLPEKAMETNTFRGLHGDDLPTSFTSGKGLDNNGGTVNIFADANKIIQGGRQNSNMEMTMMRTSVPRDTGKSPVPHVPPSSGLPFNEQQLKQLRAQCLVFLAFRNGLMPKKLHLEIALGNIIPKDGGRSDGTSKELIDHKGKAQSSDEPNSTPDGAVLSARQNNARESDRIALGASSLGRLQDANSLPREGDRLKMEDRTGLPPDLSVSAEERKNILPARKLEAEMQCQEAVELQASCMTAFQQPETGSARRGLPYGSPVNDMENGHMHVGKADQGSLTSSMNKQVNTEAVNWSRIGCHNEVPQGSLPSAAIPHNLLPERRDNASIQFQDLGNSSASAEQDDEDNSASTDSLPPPKYTMSEKWIMCHQRKRVQIEQNWLLKQQKTKQRIATCFEKLKENVSSSEDISAKTKSVIELKKLQLLELQHRLRSDFLNDFFKPVTSDMDRLKSFKKHKHGRRIKQLEKFEQKMKEERQKRIRERQKEFFAEIEVHKERLEDVFKIRRERWKGFNKYVKEFHKRKERIHREKIDRIQREKINLLKINDVEGYLRMVQDVKSDRVKQLLKETEKYLQKLGSKLQEAKTMATQFENDMDETRTATFFDKNEYTTENEDEGDQAKHYLESNEKYYMMAHSIKESIAEQPTCLLGGKLREYQMNGLRWLVSLYNNHLNGILADEMGLGKTVQVISLICYLMETKNDRGPFLVVVPSSVLPGWESEINFWAPGVHQIVYSGPPEERRRLFKEKIVHQKFNVLLTTYEYLMNKHDRPKLSKLHWHYIIIDEGHRIKNASCKLNADLKHYRSSHRLLLTGTPLQNNLEELWALLNFLLPNIFNSSEDFSQWFNKPFESNGDSSADEALLSEEENLLIINRLHQVLRPFVLRRLKHKVENQLPEKIERLIRCEASAYQKLLMKRVEENLGSIGNSKARSIHNSVMELRNICNHPYLSQLHAEEVDNLIPKHFLPPMVRLCGKLEMLDRLLPKLKATDHRVLFFSTMTRLLDIMEDYLSSKQYPYLRLDGHTSGGDRGALIDLFNGPNSPYFIFLLSIRAGGVGVNLQAADTVIIFDTDWNPQVDLQAQARAHRIGQKKDVLVLRFETVQTVEEQVRASAEHKLGVANQSITAGFFDNNTSAEDRREYLESLLRECKKEEAAPVLGDDALNDLLARSESEIDVFESVDKQRREREMATWKELLFGKGVDTSEPLPPPPSRLVTDDDLKAFYEAMKLYDVPKAVMVPNAGAKRKGQHLGGLDTRQYGRGKRAREVRSYEEQWTEEEFDKMCQVDPPDSPKVKEEVLERNLPKDASVSMVAGGSTAEPAPPPQTLDSTALQQGKDVTPPSKRGRGRPRRVTTDKSPTAVVLPAASGTGKLDSGLQKGNESSSLKTSPDSAPGSSNFGGSAQSGVEVSGTLQPSNPSDSVILESQSTPPCPSVPVHSKGRGRKAQSGVQVPRRRGKKQELAPPAPETLAAHDPNANNQSKDASIYPISVTVSSTTEVHDPNASHQSKDASINPISGTVSSITEVHCPSILPGSAMVEGISGVTQLGVALDSQSSAPIASSLSPNIQYTSSDSFIPVLVKGKGRKAQTGVGTPRRRGRKQATVLASEQDVPASLVSQPNPLSQDKSLDSQGNEGSVAGSNQRNDAQEVLDVNRNQKSVEHPDDKAPEGQCTSLSTTHDDATTGSFLGQNQSAIIHDVASVTKDVSGDNKASSVVSPSIYPPPCSAVVEGGNNTVHELAAKTTSSSPPITSCSSVAPALQPNPPEAVQVKRQGRKAPSRAEAPRRRGKKQSLVSPAVDALGLDPKSNLLPQNKSRDSPRSKQESDPKELINVVQEANLPSGLGGHDQKRKETIGIPTFGRIPTADVTDVARVMKEIFSESSKTKFGDSSWNEGKSNIPNVAVSNKMPVEVGRSQSSDGNTYSGTPSVETAAPVIGDSIVYPKQSGSGASVKMEEINSASLSEVPISQDDALKSENKTTDVAVENLGESREAYSEISVEGSSIEVCAVPLNTGVEGVSPQELAPEEAVSLQPYQGEADTPGTTQNDCVNESVPSSEPSLKLLPLDTSSPVCAISDKVNYAGDNSTERPSVSAPVEPKNAINETEDSSESSLKSSLGIGSHVILGNPDGPSSLSSDHSGSKSTHGGSEISPGNSNEPSSKESLNPPLDPCSVYPSLSCMKPNDLGDHPEVSASLPSSLYHSGVVEPSGQTSNTSGIEIQPPVKESPEPCAIDSESPERPIVSRSSDGLGDHPPVLMSFSGSEDHSVDVALDGGCPGMRVEMIGEATIESPEASQKVNDLGPDVAVGDVASTDNVVALHETSLDGDRLGGQSCGTEDKRDTLPEPQQGATSEFVTESISKSADSEKVPLAPGSAELGCLTVCSMEVGATEVQIPSPKDKIEDDNSGVSSVQEERSSKVIISEPASVEKDLEVRPGTESVECEIVEACKGRAELSEAPTSSSKGITAEAANVELIPDDHAGIQYQSMDESAAKSVAAELGRQMDGPNIGGIILKNISEYSLPSSSEVSMEENVDDLSKKSAESSPLLENVQGSELNTGNQDENVPTESEHMVRPSSLFLEGEVKENDSREKFAISVGPEGSEGSDLNMINHKDVSHFDVAVLDNRSADVVLTSSTLEAEEEKVKSSIEQGLVCSNIPDEVRGSEAEDGDGSGVCQINSMVPEEEKIDSGVSENNDLPSSYIAIEEEKIEGSSEMDPLSSSIAHMKSEGSEAELIDQIDASGAGVLVPENTSESMVPPLSSSPLEKQIIEGASEKDFIDESEALETSKNGTGGSVVEAASGNQQCHDSTAEESKRSETEEVDQAVSSQVDGTFPETASAQTVLPLSSSAMEEEKTQLLYESSPHGTSVALEESEGLKVENIGQRVGSHPCEVVTVGTSEDMGLVSSSPTKTFEGLPEENQRGIQVALEEVKKSGTEVGDLVFASHAGGTEPQDNEVNDVGPGNSPVGGICIEDASGKVDLPSACLGMLEESRNVNQPLSSSAMQEEKNEDPPQKIDEPITPVAEVDVQAHSLEAGLENMSGNKVLPSASLRNEERNGVSGNVQFGHLEPPIDSGDNSVLPSSSLGNEEKIDATSKNVHSGSSESPIDSGDNSVLPSSSLGNEEKIDETSGNFLVSSSEASTDSADNPVLPSSPHVTERNISVASDVGGPCAASEGDNPGVASSPQATEHKVDVSTDVGGPPEASEGDNSVLASSPQATEHKVDVSADVGGPPEASEGDNSVLASSPQATKEKVDVSADVGGPPEASEGDNSVLASSPQATKEKVDVSADVGGPPEASEGDDRVVVSPPQATEQKVDASTDVGGHCEGSEKDNSVLLSSPQATEQQVDVSADTAGPSAAPEGSEAAGGDKIKCFEVDGIEQENTAEDLGKHSSSIAPADERAGLSDKDPVNSELEPEESPESVAIKCMK